jgi:hypothetical protein
VCLTSQDTLTELNKRRRKEKREEEEKREEGRK